MIKQLLFLLTLINTAIHGMELVLHNNDMLSHVTHQVCTLNSGDPKKIKQNIHALTVTDQTLYKYYNSEKTRQNIIRQIALHKNLSDSMVALYFGYRAIQQKIDTLFDKISTAGFPTQNDLHDPWYLNSTIPCAYLDEGPQETLLLRAIKLHQFTTAKTLITAGIDCHSTRSYNILSFISDRRPYYSLDQKGTKIFFDIIELLLKKNIHPDSRPCTTHTTLLHQASSRNFKDLAYLLLCYGADPYATCSEKNAFDLEQGEPKGWLNTMVNEINKNK